MFLTQTPQAFNFKEIYNLHKTNYAKYKDDDISLYMDLNRVSFIEGEKSNFKITDQADFENLKSIYKSKQSVGIGFDVHRLIPKKLYLAGLKNKIKVRYIRTLWMVTLFCIQLSMLYLALVKWAILVKCFLIKVKNLRTLDQLFY